MIRTRTSPDQKENEEAKREVRKKLPAGGGGAWMEFAGLVETGDPNSSFSVDEIVYGGKD